MTHQKPTRFLLMLAGLGLALSTAPQTAQAAGSCAPLAGKWTGEMSGKFKGATSMKIRDNCRISWRLPDGRTNSCRFRNVKDTVEYKCSLGSHGIATISQNAIVMQNVFTASRHGAYTVNVTKQ